VAKIQHQAPASPEGKPGWVLVCHHCGKTWPPPEKCGNCGNPSVRVSGVGTQKVAAEVKRLIPGARVLRMDRDTVSKERKQEQSVYDRFRSRAADILVGTKLVAKSFHFPDVTLVGVVDADTMLHMPDFRSSERTMQMLAQVAGRSGRADKPGEVVLQTLSPDHEAIQGAARGDYALWADAELGERRELRYPPSSSLIRAVLTGKDEPRVVAAAQALVALLSDALGLEAEVVGPAPALLREVRGKFRHHLLVKLAPERVEAALAAARAKPQPSGVRLTLDVDPYDMF
jgi:primosomal protein N' (replication factor Y)